MERGGGQGATFGLSFPAHVQGDAAADAGLGANAIDALLHLAVAAIATLDGVGGSWQELVIEKRQGLLQVGAEQLPGM